MKPHQPRPPKRAAGLPGVCLAVAFASAGQGATAAEIDTGGDLKVRWDTTVKYSSAYRTNSPDANTTGMANINGDDGNLNFRRGLVSSRVDLLSELDLTYRNLGARVSGAAWYDSLYRRDNRNNSPATAATVPNNVFDPDTAKRHGRMGELLDAFIFGQADLGDGKTASARLGRHSLLYGESLYFGGNGIAASQGPLDAVKAQQVPSSQVKEIIKPVKQLSSQLQLSPALSVGGYYQFEWRKTVLPASGSFLSNSDQIDDGGRRVFTGPPLRAGGGRQALFRAADLNADDRGQYGTQLRWHPAGSDAEFGFYYTRAHSKTPILHVAPAVVDGVGVVNPAAFNPATGQVGTYSLVYAEGIRTTGASVSTMIGDMNLAAEASVRANMPLVVVAVPVLPGHAMVNHGDVLYPVGKSAHAQVSAIYALPRGPLWDSATLSGELAWHRRLRIDRHAELVDPASTRDASAVRVVLEAAYFQVASGVDLTVPVGVGYGLSGRSSVISGFSVYHGGDISIGVNADYQKTWKFGLSLVRFTGASKPLTTAADTPTGLGYTFGQTLADRHFIAFNVQRTF